MAGGSLLGTASATGIDGGLGDDTIQGPDAATDWTLTGAGVGRIGAVDTGTRFTGIENMRGGTDTDTFTITNGSLSGTLDGGTIEIDGTGVTTSTNTLDFSGTTPGITIDLAAESGGGIASFANITGVTGTSGTGDILRGPAPLADQVRWAITGANGGTVDGTVFSGFETLNGRDTTDDAFVFFAGGTVGTINGGAGGTDGFAVVDGGVLRAFQPTTANGTANFKGVTVAYTGLEAFDPFGGDATNLVVNGSIFDRSATLELSGGTFILTFAGLTFGTIDQSEFTVAERSASLTLISGTGGDVITTTVDPDYTLVTFVDGTLSVNLRNTVTSDVAELALDTAAPDPVSVDGGLMVTLTVNGFLQRFGSFGSGVRVVDVSGRAGNDTLSVRETLPIEITFTGGAGTDTLQGPVRGSNWTITGIGSGSGGGTTSFTAVERLLGGSDTVLGTASDRFVFEVGGTISGLIDGGAGIDEIVGAAQTNNWSVTGTDAGTLNATNFTSIENLTGGTGNDTFTIGTAGDVTGVIDGGLDVDIGATTPGTPPTDTLNFATVATAVSVNLGLATASGVAGFTGIDVIAGRSGPGDTLIGPGDVGRSRRVADHWCRHRRGRRDTRRQRCHHHHPVQRLRESPRSRDHERLVPVHLRRKSERHPRRWHRTRCRRRSRRVRRHHHGGLRAPHPRRCRDDRRPHDSLCRARRSDLDDLGHGRRRHHRLDLRRHDHGRERRRLGNEQGHVRRAVVHL